MNRVMTLSIMLLAAAAICVNAHAAEQQATAERPNIIFLLSDDQAWKKGVLVCTRRCYLLYMAVDEERSMRSGC